MKNLRQGKVALRVLPKAEAKAKEESHADGEVQQASRYT